MKYLIPFLILTISTLFSCKIKTLPKVDTCVKKDTVYISTVVRDTIKTDRLIYKDTIVYKDVIKYIDVYKYIKDTIIVTKVEYKEDLSKIVSLNTEIQKLIYTNQNCEVELTKFKTLTDSLQAKITKLQTQLNQPVQEKSDWLYYVLLGILISAVTFIIIKLIQTYKITN